MEKNSSFVSFGAPAQQGDVVDDGFLEVALLQQILKGRDRPSAWRACGR